MKAAVGPILTGLFAVLGLFGVNFSEDVRAVIHDNLAAVVSAIIVLLGVMPSVVDAFKKKPAEPDEHTLVDKQRGFAAPKMLGALALASMLALAAGCASFGSGAKSLTPDQRAAGVLIDAKAIADTCGELYKADLIGQGDAMACLQYVTQAIDYAQGAHFAIVAGDSTPETAASIEEYLKTAEQIIAGLQKVLAGIQAENKTVSTKVWHGAAPLDGVGV